jgi:hypothetical protein
VRTAFLDDVSAAEAGGAGGRQSAGCRSGSAAAYGARISHEMSRGYVLEYPVDDPDEDDEDDFDEEDDEGDEDEDEDEEEIETWQVSGSDPSAKGCSLLDFRD